MTANLGIHSDLCWVCVPQVSCLSNRTTSIRRGIPVGFQCLTFDLPPQASPDTAAAADYAWAAQEFTLPNLALQGKLLSSCSAPLPWHLRKVVDCVLGFTLAACAWKGQVEANVMPFRDIGPNL